MPYWEMFDPTFGGMLGSWTAGLRGGKYLLK
jgi:hypothetical protein